MSKSKTLGGDKDRKDALSIKRGLKISSISFIILLLLLLPLGSIYQDHTVEKQEKTRLQNILEDMEVTETSEGGVLVGVAIGVAILGTFYAGYMIGAEQSSDDVSWEETEDYVYEDIKGDIDGNYVGWKASRGNYAQILDESVLYNNRKMSAVARDQYVEGYEDFDFSDALKRTGMNMASLQIHSGTVSEEHVSFINTHLKETPQQMEDHGHDDWSMNFYCDGTQLTGMNSNRAFKLNTGVSLNAGGEVPNFINVKNETTIYIADDLDASPSYSIDLQETNGEEADYTVEDKPDWQEVTIHESGEFTMSVDGLADGDIIHSPDVIPTQSLNYDNLAHSTLIQDYDGNLHGLYRETRSVEESGDSQRSFFKMYNGDGGIFSKNIDSPHDKNITLSSAGIDVFRTHNYHNQDLTNVQDIISTARDHGQVTFNELEAGNLDSDNIVYPDQLTADPEALRGMDKIELQILYRAYLEGLNDQLQDSNSVDYDDIQISKASFSTRIEGTIKDKDGNYVVGSDSKEMSFVPMARLNDQTLTKGNNTVDEAMHIFVLGEAGGVRDVLDWEMAEKNYTIQANTIYYEGDKVDKINLETTSFEFLAPQYEGSELSWLDLINPSANPFWMAYIEAILIVGAGVLVMMVSSDQTGKQLGLVIIVVGLIVLAVMYTGNVLEEKWWWLI